MSHTFFKDKDSTLDYTFDWSNWLEDGESISSHVISADAGITVDSSVDDGSVVTVWLSGGTDGDTYKVNCKITTDNTPSRVEQRTLIIKIKEK